MRRWRGAGRSRVALCGGMSHHIHPCRRSSSLSRYITARDRAAVGDLGPAVAVTAAATGILFLIGESEDRRVHEQGRLLQNIRGILEGLLVHTPEEGTSTHQLPAAGRCCRVPPKLVHHGARRCHTRHCGWSRGSSSEIRARRVHWRECAQCSTRLCLDARGCCRFNCRR